ncbi:MAG: hypothetical protein NT147_03670 [Candidatus Aminicenantes bacterium]|nr:hypothetical protein [Candidatus Aminicenantes bacterium]
MKQPDIIEVTLIVTRVFDDLKIDYYIGGSLASSAFGVARATMDVDIVADIEAGHVPEIEKRLKDAFYIDRELVERAIRERSSFNLIHFESLFKVDVFVPPTHPFERQVFARKQTRAVSEDGSQKLFFSSPEDIILRKLVWYQSSGGVSDRQWQDVLGVLKVQSEKLDKAYLEDWAAKLGVAELLRRAYRDSGMD